MVSKGYPGAGRCLRAPGGGAITRVENVELAEEKKSKKAAGLPGSPAGLGVRTGHPKIEAKKKTVFCPLCKKIDFLTLNLPRRALFQIFFFNIILNIFGRFRTL